MLVLLLVVLIYSPGKTINKSDNDWSFIKINPKDGAEMLLVPGGEFLMGSPENEGYTDEHPMHKVYLDTFYIYKYEVTNRQFEEFVNETGYIAQGKWRYNFKPGMENHPVGCVSWNDALSYCNWAEVKLPTEAEWEKAAKGTDTRKYPWGNNWEENRCNWFKGPKLPGMAIINQGRGTLPVGSFPLGASPYGALDMAGNVYEWCSDFYNETYYKNSPSANPKGPTKGDCYVLRGGCCFNDIRVCFRCANRFRVYSYNWAFTIGFRCAYIPEKKFRKKPQNF